MNDSLKDRAFNFTHFIYSDLKLLFFLLFAMGWMMPTANAQTTIRLGRESPVYKLQFAEMAINNLYVDSVNEESLVEDAIRGMLEKLDPHSSYISAKEVKAINEPLQGSFDGIGIQFNVFTDTLMVVQTISGGPSARAGILAGDRIVNVDDTVIAGMKLSREEMVRKLRGPRGSIVRVGIIRPGIKGMLSFSIKRDKIPLYSVDAVYMIRPGIGYIRIGNFAATTYSEFMNALSRLRSKGMQHLILDLQENGGGYMEAAVKVANEFLDKGDMIVYTKGRNYVQSAEYRADGNGCMRKGQIVVLIDEFSASASEIVAGALQDQDRGSIVGRRSFGKGLVQRPVDLPDGSMIRLTIAHYYTPAGRCIQKPYRKGGLRDYASELDNRLKRGELMHADSIHFADSLRYKTLRLGRTVYGGGGIMPDDFVSLDTLHFTSFHRKLMAKSIIINAHLRYFDQHRKRLKALYKSFDDFNSRYEVPAEELDSILAEGERLDIKPADAEERRRTLDYIRIQLKGLVARDLWNVSEYFQVVNEKSDIVNRALHILQQSAR